MEHPKPILPAVFNPFLEFFSEPEREAQGNWARDALQTLCELGERTGNTFRPQTLALLLNLLRMAKDAMQSGRRWEPLRYGTGAGECFTQRDLQRIANHARALREHVLKLKLTSFVFDLHIQGRIPRRDLLYLSFKDNREFVPEGNLVALDTVMRVPALAREHKRLLRKPTDYALWRVCRYVKQTTGSWNDSLLAHILGPLEIPGCGTAGDLKEWRSRFIRRVTEEGRKPGV